MPEVVSGALTGDGFREYWTLNFGYFCDNMKLFTNHFHTVLAGNALTCVIVTNLQ